MKFLNSIAALRAGAVAGISAILVLGLASCALFRESESQADLRRAKVWAVYSDPKCTALRGPRTTAQLAEQISSHDADLTSGCVRVTLRDGDTCYVSLRRDMVGNEVIPEGEGFTLLSGITIFGQPKARRHAEFLKLLRDNNAYIASHPVDPEAPPFSKPPPPPKPVPPKPQPPPKPKKPK